MKGQTNRSIIGNALQRTLRTRMTDAENRLWRELRDRQIAGYKFRRQHPFMDYVLDFVCLEERLVVEVDGGQHQGNERDAVRDHRLHEAGFRVLRFWNNQVLREIDAVTEAIFTALHSRSESARDPHPHPNPPLEGEGASTDVTTGHSTRLPNPPLEGEGALTDVTTGHSTRLPNPPFEGEGASMSASACPV